jgi:hypothetical protein
MIKNKKINFLMLLMFLFSFSMIIACDSGSNRETDPDIPPPVVGDDDDDVVGDDDDDIVPPVVGMGAIRGSVTSPTGIPLNGVHVRAINIDNTDLQMSSFSGIDCDLILLDGEFCIQNVPAGTYRVLIEKMDDRSSAFDPERYSLFVIAGTTLDFPDEYWNGADESDEDTPSDFEPIVVSNGSTVNGIDIITNDTP